jgi:ppGpp synthetase/RelA/SpoT-type nucleotidyltranferase
MIDDAEQQRNFLETYRTHIEQVLAPTKRELRELFNEWQDPSFWSAAATRSRMPSPSPIQSTKTRIKRPETVVDKIFRHPGEYPDGLAFDSIPRMLDVVAGRIVVYFLANLPLIDREIRNSTKVEISSEKPPVAYLTHDVYNSLGLQDFEHKPKASGYSSLHYYVRLRHSTVPPDRRPLFEIQVRTLTEHCWGEVEHILGYKPNKRTSLAVKRQFQIISKQLEAIDEHFNVLYEELARFQEEVSYRDNDPLNAENLPAVLSELGTGCAQREISGLLKLLVSRGISTVAALRQVAATRTMDLIRNTFRAHEGRDPTNFEVVASLAAIRGETSEAAMTKAVRTQIEFLKAWEDLRKTI